MTRLRRVLLLSVVTIESVDPTPLLSVNNEESSTYAIMIT